MNEFGFDYHSSGPDFSFFSEGGEMSIGPYIPEVRDCVSCGVCVNSCPTYGVKAEEIYGPRGRIRLIERVLIKNDVLDDEELEALGACTLCRACETVCPSKMDYNELYRQAMEAIDHKPYSGWAIKLLLDWVADRRSAQRLLNTLAHIYQRSGMQRVVKKFPLKGDFRQFEKLLPVPLVSMPVPDYSQTKIPEHRGEVVLFTGCVSNIIDTQTHNATIRLLTCLGYDVRVLENQTCCGAIYAHNGEMGRAKGCAGKNIDAITESGVSSVIYNASGCGAFLNEYPALLNDDGGDESPNALSTIDVMDFLVGTKELGSLPFRELKARVAVHEPCSQRNVLKNQEVVYDLLANIPGLEVVPLPGNNMCCGAGGTKMVTQPELAEPPRDEKVSALVESGADILISTNLTCALHLSTGAREADHEIEVMHPARLIAQQLI
ncbi:MAG: (Fe-S)-binding protein [Sedimenticola sp.]